MGWRAGDPPGGAHLRARRHARRDHERPSVPGGTVLAGCRRRDPPRARRSSTRTSWTRSAPTSSRCAGSGASSPRPDADRPDTLRWCSTPTGCSRSSSSASPRSERSSAGSSTGAGAEPAGCREPARTCADAARRPGRARAAAARRRPEGSRLAPLRLRLALPRRDPGALDVRARRGAEATTLVRGHLVSRSCPRRASIHDRIVKRFFTEMNATLRGFLIIALIAGGRRRALAPVGARDRRRLAADRVLPRDRVLPLPALAREARRHRGVAATGAGTSSTRRSCSPSSTSAPSSGSARAARTRSRSSSCSAAAPTPSSASGDRSTPTADRGSSHLWSFTARPASAAARCRHAPRVTISAFPTVHERAQGVTLAGLRARAPRPTRPSRSRRRSAARRAFREAFQAHTDAGGRLDDAIRADDHDDAACGVEGREECRGDGAGPGLGSAQHPAANSEGLRLRGRRSVQAAVLEAACRHSAARSQCWPVAGHEEGRSDGNGRRFGSTFVWSSAEFSTVVPRGTLVRAVFPCSQASPCYLAGFSNQLRT